MISMFLQIGVRTPEEGAEILKFAASLGAKVTETGKKDSPEATDKPKAKKGKAETDKPTKKKQVEEEEDDEEDDDEEEAPKKKTAAKPTKKKQVEEEEDDEEDNEDEEGDDEEDDEDIDEDAVKKAFAAALKRNPDHKTKIKKMLTKLGAERISDLKPKHYAEMHEFLEGLK